MGAESTATLRVMPHPTGEWVVARQGRCLAVSPSLGRALLPFHEQVPSEAAVRRRLESAAGLDAGQSGAVVSALFRAGARAAGRSRRRALWLRVPLIPARWTAAVAYRLRRLASWRGLAILAAGGTAGYLSSCVWPAASVPVDGIYAAAALLLFLGAALWHEFGHAAALAREGYPPGGIGAGLLFVVPVLFADVTPLGALSRRGRIRVDVAGVCFQLGAGGLLCAVGAWLPAARTAGWFALFAVAWSLLPFIRSDGYWFLCDALELRDLRGPVPPDRGRGLQIFLRGFQVANGAFLALVVSLVGYRAFGWAVRLLAIWRAESR